jgi:hypothetical protein
MDHEELLDKDVARIEKDVVNLKLSIRTLVDGLRGMEVSRGRASYLEQLASLVDRVLSGQTDEEQE